MTNKILVKRSNTPGATPGAGSLDYGELAINYQDGNLFYKNASNVVTVIASNQFLSVAGNVTGGNVISLGNITTSGTITANAVTYTNVDGSNGQVLSTYGNGVTYFRTVASSSGGNIYVYGRSGTIVIAISNGFLVIDGRTGNIEVPVQP
jgi:hypothetical protein